MQSREINFLHPFDDARSFNLFMKPDYHRISIKFHLNRDETILDLGCGDGTITNQLAERFRIEKLSALMPLRG